MYKEDEFIVIYPFSANEIFNTNKYEIESFRKNGKKVVIIREKEKVENSTCND